MNSKDPLYRQMLSYGATATNALRKINSSSYMRTLIRQRKPQNPHGGYHDPFTGVGTIVSSVSTLYDESTGLCTLTGIIETDLPKPDLADTPAVLGAGYGAGGGNHNSNHGSHQNRVVMETSEANSSVEDTYVYDPNKGINAASVAAIGAAVRTMATMNYNLPTEEALNKVVEQEMAKSSNGSSQEHKLIELWVNLTMGTGLNGRSPGDTSSGGGNGTSSDSDTSAVGNMGGYPHSG